MKAQHFVSGAFLTAILFAAAPAFAQAAGQAPPPGPGAGFGGIVGPRGHVETQPDDPATIEQARAQIAALNAQIHDIIGETNRDAMDAAAAKIEDLIKDRDQLNIVLAGKKAREHELQIKIDQLTTKADELVKTDDTLAQLRKIADLKQAAVETAHARVKVATISPAEESAAVIDAAEAMVHVDERREAIIASVGGGALPALNRELLVTSLDLNEQLAKLSFIEQRLTQLHQVQALQFKVFHLRGVAQQLQTDQQK